MGFTEARMSAALLGAYIEYLGIDLMEICVRGTPTLADHFEQAVSMPTITYRVFHHDLLITKLHYIDFKKYTDGIYSSKGMLHGYQKI